MEMHLYKSLGAFFPSNLGTKTMKKYVIRQGFSRYLLYFQLPIKTKCYSHALQCKLLHNKTPAAETTGAKTWYEISWSGRARWHGCSTNTDSFCLGQMQFWHTLQLSTKHPFHSPTVYLHFCISADFFWLQRQLHLQGFIFLFDTLLLIFPHCTKELAPVPLSQMLLCRKWKP